MPNLPLVAQTLDYSCGAACFESMVRYLRQESPGELFFAQALGTLDLGYTPPENVAKLAQEYEFNCVAKTDATEADLRHSLDANKVVIITWWDEDAGHYSILQSIESNDTVILMDPWVAREGRTHRLPLSDFLGYWRQRGSRMIAVS